MADEPGADPSAKISVSNVLSGVVSGSSVQAGAIHGGVHVHQPALAVVPMPRQLLAPSAHFTNRVAELKALDQLLVAGVPAFAVLSGPGGVGKTALALWWAHQVQDRFSDGQLYVDLAGFGGDEPLDPGEVLSSFLRGLGVPEQRVPLELAEQAAMYRSVTSGRSLLVLLDNAFSAAQVRVLLPGSPSSAVVVTSRRRLAGLFLDGARLVEVAPLQPADAVSLLGRVAGEQRILRERDPAEDIARVCGGLPIAVCLAAARLAARPRLSLRRAASDFVDEGRRLHAFSLDGDPSVQRIFDASYRLLSKPAATLYRRLALHPGRELSLGLAAAVRDGSAIDRPGQARSDPLGELIEANLLEELPGDRFRFHDLLRLHARERAEIDDTEGEQHAAVMFMLEWYLAAATRADLILTPYRRRLPYTFTATAVELPEFEDRAAALSWLERERTNMTAAGRVALDQGHPELAWHLCYVMWPLFLYRKHYRDRLEVDRRGVRAAQQWGHVWAQADMLKRLARMCTTAGYHEEAEEHLHRSQTLCRDIDDDRGAADALEALASLRVYTGRLEEAAGLFQQVLTVNRDLGQERSLGMTLINLGFLLPRLGRVQQAVELLREAQEIFTRLTDIDPYNSARVLVALAGAHLAAGELDSARDAAARAGRAMQDLGSESGQAEALEVLGEVAHRQGDNDTALTHLRDALAIHSRLGSTHESRLQERVRELTDPTDRTDSAAAAQPASDLNPER